MVCTDGSVVALGSFCLRDGAGLAQLVGWCTVVSSVANSVKWHLSSKSVARVVFLVSLSHHRVSLSKCTVVTSGASPIPGFGGGTGFVRSDEIGFASVPCGARRMDA